MLLNHGAILPCRLAGNKSSAQTWRFVAVGETNSALIYAHSKVQGNFTSLIQATRNEFGLQDLVILRTPSSLAGTYTCIAEGEVYQLKMVILGKYEFIVCHFHINWILYHFVETHVINIINVNRNNIWTSRSDNSKNTIQPRWNVHLYRNGGRLVQLSKCESGYSR